MTAHRSAIATLGRGDHVGLDQATLRKVTREAEGLAVAIAATALLRQMPVDPDAGRHLRELAAVLGASCAEDGCTKPSRARGRCDGHYRTRILRHGKACANCAQRFLRRAEETPEAYAERVHCGRSCALSAKAKADHAARRANRIEDLRWIAGTDSTENIAARLGYKDAGSLLRTVARWDVPDLLATLWRHTSEGLAA